MSCLYGVTLGNKTVDIIVDELCKLIECFDWLWGVFYSRIPWKQYWHLVGCPGEMIWIYFGLSLFQYVTLQKTLNQNVFPQISHSLRWIHPKQRLAYIYIQSRSERKYESIIDTDWTSHSLLTERKDGGGSVRRQTWWDGGPGPPA